MSQKPDISSQDTTQFLQEKFDAQISELTLLSGGEWSQAYSFIHQGRKYVLRWCNSSETFEKDTFASSFSSDTLPVPKIIAEGMKYDKYFAISEFAQGKFIEALSPIELEKTLPSLFNLFDALRNADLSKSTGYGGWDKSGIGGLKWPPVCLCVEAEDKCAGVLLSDSRLSNLECPK